MWFDCDLFQVDARNHERTRTFTEDGQVSGLAGAAHVHLADVWRVTPPAENH